MKRVSRDILNNDRGYVLLVAVIMLSVVMMIGYAAIRTTTTELQISGNQKLIVNEFYSAEGGAITMMETPDTWLTTPFLTGGETASKFTGSVDVNSDGENDAAVEIRCIEETGTSIGGLSAAANSFPAMDHIGPPPVGSGYSLKYFEVRRYGVTATAEGSSRVQVGMWKVFNKY